MTVLRLAAMMASVALFAGSAAAEQKRVTFAGQEIVFDAAAADLEPTVKLMQSFMAAYVTADPEKLAAVLAPDFVWHLHSSVGRHDQGIVSGVDGMLKTLADRKRTWRDVRYSAIRFTAAPGLITQTYRVSGTDEKGPFAVEGVDLYVIRDGRIAVKDSYWKQLGR